MKILFTTYFFFHNQKTVWLWWYFLILFITLIMQSFSSSYIFHLFPNYNISKAFHSIKTSLNVIECYIFTPYNRKLLNRHANRFRRNAAYPRPDSLGKYVYWNATEKLVGFTIMRWGEGWGGGGTWWEIASGKDRRD